MSDMMLGERQEMKTKIYSRKDYRVRDVYLRLLKSPNFRIEDPKGAIRRSEGEYDIIFKRAVQLGIIGGKR